MKDIWKRSGGLLAVLTILSSGCCGAEASLREPELTLDPGTTRLLSAEVKGLKTATWEIVNAPASCRGAIDPPRLGEVEAVFRAPQSCDVDTPEGLNAVRLTAQMDCGSPATLTVNVKVRRGNGARETGNPSVSRQPGADVPPATTDAAQSRSSAERTLKRIVPQFGGGEVFFVFNDGPTGFRATHRRLPDLLEIRLDASQQQAGFGGVCINSADVEPFDASGFSAVEIDLSTLTPRHVLDIKLEQQDSTAVDGQVNLNTQALPRPGRQLVRLSLLDAPLAVRKNVRRICFAMSVVGFRGTPLVNEVQIYEVRFVK